MSTFAERIAWLRFWCRVQGWSAECVVAAADVQRMLLRMRGLRAGG